MDLTNCSLPSLPTSCQHHGTVISRVNKGEAEKSALVAAAAIPEEQLTQNASSFLIVPALETMVEYSPAAAAHNNQLAIMQDSKNGKDEAAAAESSSSVAQDGLLEKVSIVKCTSCDKSVALFVGGKYKNLQNILHDDTKLDGWQKTENEKDRLVLFILNQIIYREYEVPDEDELQVEYAFPSGTDLTKILWIKGNAVGFYSAKLKGSLDLESMDWYRMTVLDTLFIRNSDRRKGYASSAIEDILLEFPDQNIGFSMPISLPMVQVLKKHLVSHPSDRMKLWEVDGTGLEGNCQILWFLLKRR